MAVNRLRVSNTALTFLILFFVSPLISASPLFEDGFESKGLKTTKNNISWGESVYASVSTDHAKDGLYSLKFTYAATDEKTDTWSEQRFRLGKPYKEIWISYDIRIPENYHHRKVSYGSSNNKGFIMLWSGDYSKPTGIVLGTEFWAEKDGSSTASVRLAGVGFDKHFWGACPSIIKLSDRGRWIKITAHLKYATPENNDGIMRLWKTYEDGKSQIACNISDGAWYSAVSPGFDAGYILGWSNSGFNEETKFYVDNFTVSEAPLMPILLPPADTKRETN